MANIFNADDGAISGSAGIKLSSDTSGVLNIQTNGTTAISVSSSQVVSFPATTTLDFSGTVTLSGGTANGVTYLNGSKALTSGSALTFDGTALSPDGTSRTLGTTALRWGTVYATALSDGTDQLVGSSGVSARFGYGASWTSLAFAISGSEAMRLTSTGLGIGTSSPGTNLQIGTGSSTGLGVFLSRGATTNFFEAFDGTKRFIAGTDSANAFVKVGSLSSHPVQLVAGNGAGYLYLDTSGNLGLGVTPSAWASSYKSFQLGSTASLVGATNFTFLNTNVYFDSSDTPRYLTTAASTIYRQTAGAHAWLTAASGTAGNAITFTQAMTLDASGSLKIGASNAGGTMLGISDGATDATSYGSVQVAKVVDHDNKWHYACVQAGQEIAGMGFQDNVNQMFVVGRGGNPGSTNCVQFYGPDNSTRFLTNGSERARITSTGNFGVATSSPSYLVDIASSTGTAAHLRATGSFITRKYTFSENLAGPRTLRVTLTVTGLQFVNFFLDMMGHYYVNGGQWEARRFAFQFMCEGTTLRLNQRMPNYEYGGSTAAVFTVGNPPSWTHVSGNTFSFDFTVATGYPSYISVLVEGPGIENITITQIS